MDVVLFQFIGETFNNALDSYATTVASSVISAITATAVLGGTLYYAVMGMLMAIGRVDGPFSQFVVSCIKFTLIAAIALNVGTYGSMVIDSVRGMETGLADAFAGNSGAKSASIYQTIDKAVQDGWDIAAVLYERGNNRGWTEILLGLSEIGLGMTVALATMVIAVPAGAMIIGAHALLSLLLGIGPLFVLAIGWGPVKGYFDRWFGQVMTGVMQIALVSAVLAIALKLFTFTVAKVDVDSATQSTLFAVLELFVLTLVMLYLMYRAYEIGGTLGGGMSANAITLGAMAARAASIAGAPIAAGRAIGGAINPTSTRRDLESGMMVTAGRTNHFIAGNTMWNPSYMQHVLDNVGKNWGRARGGSISN
ncbi:conjugal transfer protein TraH [Xanthomonas citri pv. citri]|uniref:Type IV secretion system protein n=1 Tax=Xanthomonas citri pv. durantae TaxID=487862 RepID=A0A9X6BFE8_XANCI|nr:MULTISPECIES: type IV secretion system protein [Xanthomonas]MEB1187355.1 type IV secretion system protein [Xanthomonas campestris pv. campestris]RWU13134.1 type IV secretion system protein [Xanthomonas phaseoli pv. manihotis str. CIO151]AGH79877.1 TrbL/VirB6 plasmid conjugal transfer protein [Xanthomonas axonopodis Xac29-1]APR18143.1 conjugal transfer protein TraH [Xanthomonas citri pv. citri]APR22812.1 conjugal transfer protein TraH [Xanthomonas citri pv. citri]